MFDLIILKFPMAVGLGEERDPEGKIGWGCTDILFKQKKTSPPDLVEIRNLIS